MLVTKRRNVIVHIATSADGFIARPDGNLDGLVQLRYRVQNCAYAASDAFRAFVGAVTMMSSP